jgi:RNA-directed DNA polymerase
MGLERRDRAGQVEQKSTSRAGPSGEEPMGRPRSKVKSFDIPKRLIVDAWEKVKVNAGAPGVDAVSVAQFDADVKNSLYKVWNRMSAGSYMPGPVRAVEIPKSDGGVRVLGVPNVVDRVAQTAVAMLLEERVDPIFHPDSFGYRPGRSALDAVGTTRERCWKYDWVVDMDIRAFFDSVPHHLLMKAVALHTDQRWVLLYIERWLKAPMEMADGTLLPRETGTPQGSPISPVLANLYMHYAFDRWMAGMFPGCPFERYADDSVIHCGSEKQARLLVAAVAERFRSVGLELHPGKTKVVYCKDGQRHGTAEHTSFDFLGYRFRARLVQGPRGLFVGFHPAISNKALKRIGKQIRNWHLNRRSGHDLSGVADEINSQVRGWINYYGRFYRSELYSLARRIDQHLIRWAMQKYKRLRGKTSRAWAWLNAIRERQPTLFAHWHLLPNTNHRPVGAG